MTIMECSENSQGANRKKTHRKTRRTMQIFTGGPWMELIQNMRKSRKYENQDDYNGMLREFLRSQQEENS